VKGDIALRSLGICEYRQLFFKPYRLIYRVHAKRVVVYVVSDGRRDMESLPARRLLGAQRPGAAATGSIIRAELRARSEIILRQR
jgi:hypothetical protein